MVTKGYALCFAEKFSVSAATADLKGRKTVTFSAKW
jgi:hypothetical protein